MTPTRKSDIHLARYVTLVDYVRSRRNSPDEGPVVVEVTVEDIGLIWDCSPRAVRETLARLRTWRLVQWEPRAGRGRRSALTVLVHPVHVYFTRARRAEAAGRWAKAGFWYQEILRDCPCLPEVPLRLQRVRQALGLAVLPDAAQSG